ncbi:MAG: hypothetical protein ABSB87_11850 [Terriglobales bacterium]
MTNMKHEIDRHARFGQRLEDLIYHAAKDGKIVYHTKRDDLFVSYWSLVFNYSKGIVCLAANELYSPAFALMRPLVEAVVREHIARVGSDDEVKKIRTDRFKVNYDRDGERWALRAPVLRKTFEGSEKCPTRRRLTNRRLTNLTIDHEIGVTARSLKVPKLDSDYFEE